MNEQSSKKSSSPMIEAINAMKGEISNQHILHYAIFWPGAVEHVKICADKSDTSKAGSERLRLPSFKKLSEKNGKVKWSKPKWSWVTEDFSEPHRKAVAELAAILELFARAAVDPVRNDWRIDPKPLIRCANKPTQENIEAADAIIRDMTLRANVEVMGDDCTSIPLDPWGAVNAIARSGATARPIVPRSKEDRSMPIRVNRFCDILEMSYKDFQRDLTAMQQAFGLKKWGSTKYWRHVTVDLSKIPEEHRDDIRREHQTKKSRKTFPKSIPSHRPVNAGRV